MTLQLFAPCRQMQSAPHQKTVSKMTTFLSNARCLKYKSSLNSRNMGILWSEIREMGFKDLLVDNKYFSKYGCMCKYFADRLVRLVVREKVSNKRSNTFSGMSYDLYFWKYS